jgi:UDP-2,3-diacylglucosamine hydrolase
MTKKIYFASDFHLGADVPNGGSRERERVICRWLDSIKHDAERLYLVGDIFDFWFEYRRAIPKGYIRLFGKLAELRDMGIPIEFFIGNHDMWMFRYFEDELGIPIHRGHVVREHHGKTFFIHHGDGLGPSDYKYKFLKKVFANPLCQFLFGWLHPDIGIAMADAWSNTSRKKQKQKGEDYFLGPEGEWLIAYCERKVKPVPADYYVFGHRHIPIDYTLSTGKHRYINLGEWMHFNSYAVFDGNDIEIRFFENQEGRTFPYAEASPAKEVR